MAAGDTALIFVLRAQDLASQVVANMASTFDSSIATMGDATVALTSSLAGLDASFASLDASTASVDATLSSADAALAGLDASTASVDAALASVAASTTGVDAALTGIDASAATTGAAITSLDQAFGSMAAISAGLDPTLGSVDAALMGLDEAIGGVDAALASVGAAATGTDASLASVGTAAAEADAALASTATAAEGTAASMEGAGAAGGGLAMGLNPVALAGTVVAGVLGNSAVQASQSFQQSMLKNSALAGLTGDQFTQMSNQIMAQAPKLGQAPAQLSDGLYNVLSAGVPASQAMSVLSLSAMAAATGMTDTYTITNGLTSAMNASSISWDKATNVMAMLTATVTNGKMTWQNLASSIGMTATTAHESQISLIDASAALATMTDSGMSANRAGMDLDFLMRQLGMNVDKVAASAKGMGLSFDETKFKTDDLMSKLQYLQQITGGNTAELMKLEGGATGAAAAQAILTNSGSLYASILEKVTAATREGDATQQAYATTQQGFTQQMNQLNAAWQTLLITLGNALMPGLTQLAETLTPLISGFANWIQQSGAVQDAMMALSTAVGWVVQGIAWLASVFAQIGSVIAPIFTNLDSAAQTWGQNFMAGFINGVESMIGVLVNLVVQVVTEIANYIGFASPAKKGPGKNLMQWGQGLVQGFAQSIAANAPLVSSAASTVASHLQAGLTTTVYAKGGLAGNAHILGPAVAPPLQSAATAPVAQNASFFHTAGSAMATGLANSLSAGTSVVAQATTGINNALQNVCSTAHAVSSCASTALTQTLAQQIQANSPNMQNALNAVIQYLESIGYSAQNATQLATTVINTGLSSGISGGVNGVQTGTDAITKSLLNMGLSAQDASQIASTAMTSGLAIQIQQGVSALPPAAASVASQITAGMSPGLQQSTAQLTQYLMSIGYSAQAASQMATTAIKSGLTAGISGGANSVQASTTAIEKSLLGMGVSAQDASKAAGVALGSGLANQVSTGAALIPPAISKQVAATSAAGKAVGQAAVGGITQPFNALGGILTTKVNSPLQDTFDRATAIIHPINSMGDTFDRAKGIIQSTTQTLTPFQRIMDAIKANWPTVEAVILGVMAGIAAAIIAAGIAALPSISMLILQFSLWAAVAAVVALDTIVAAAPFILIGIAVAALVIGFILLYQHCQFVRDIIAALGQAFQQVWQILVASFQPVLAQLWQTIQTQLAPAWNQLMQALAPVMPVLQSIGVAIVGIVVVALGLLIGIIGGVIKGFAAWLTGMIQVFGGVVQMVSGVIQIIVGIFRLLFDFITGNWSQLGADLQTILGGVLMFFQGWWNAVTGVFQAVTGFLIGLVGGFIQTIVVFFTGLYNALVGHSILPDLVNGIIGWFLNLYQAGWTIIGNLVVAVGQFFLNMAGNVGQAVQNMFANVVGWFGNLYNTIVGHSIVPDMVNGVSSQFSLMNRNASNSTALMNQNVLSQFQQMNTNTTAQATGAAANVQDSFYSMNTNTTATANQWSTNIQGIFGNTNTNIDAMMQQFSSSTTGQFSQLQASGTQQVSQMQINMMQQFNALTVQGSASFATLVQQIASSMQSLDQQANNSMQQIVNTIQTDMNTLITLAPIWGHNLMQGFINGMNSVPLVGAVTTIATTISDYLGYHSPTRRGPGSTADQWAPAFVNMFAGGLLAGQSKVAIASNALASSMALPNSSAALARSGGSSGMQHLVINNTLEIDGRAFATATAEHIGQAQHKQIQLRTGMR